MKSVRGALAAAVWLGWLPLVAVNAVFVQRTPLELDAAQTALHHLYVAGQLLGLAAASGLLVLALGRLRPVHAAVAGFAVLVAASHALLAPDLANFLERHPDHRVLLQLGFTLIAALGLAASYAAGAVLARGRLRYAGVALGVGAAIANHLFLELSYPGTHFIVAWAAAALIGTSLHRWLAAAPWQGKVRVAVAAASAASVLSYAVPPGAVVRSALLSSSGAVAAPFVTRLWAARAESDREPEAAPASTVEIPAEWLGPRDDLPAVPAERLPGAPAAPIVVLLTVDALRSDAVEEPHASKKKVPNLLAMGQQALRFERVWTPAPYTMAALRSMFQGIYYVQQAGTRPKKQRRKAGQRAKVPRRPYLATLLEQGGVSTVNLRAHEVLGRGGSVCRGFGEEIDLGHRAPSEQVIDALLERLPAGAQGPLFLYSHIMDPHAPYDRGGKRGSAKRRYLAEVSIVDEQIGKLRKQLRERGLNRTTYLIVAADHAEAFGEHGHYYHSSTVYEEMIRIPLLIEGPGIAPRRVERAVTLLDLGPTILSLFGLDTPAHVFGQSLVPFMRGETPVLTRPVAVDSGRAIRAMLFDQRWKAIVDVQKGTEEVYDLLEDPEERRNLAERAEMRGYLDALRAFFAGLNAPAK